MKHRRQSCPTIANWTEAALVRIEKSEAQLAALLDQLGEPVAPADEAKLAEARQRAAEEFAWLDRLDWSAASSLSARWYEALVRLEEDIARKVVEGRERLRLLPVRRFLLAASFVEGGSVGIGATSEELQPLLRMLYRQAVEVIGLPGHEVSTQPERQS